MEENSILGIYVSKEQYTAACSVDLYDWLLSHHRGDVTVEGNSVLLRADRHVSVRQGFHGFKVFNDSDDSTGRGNNVDYLMRFLGYSYPDAVLALLDEVLALASSVQEKIPDAPVSRAISLPKAAGTRKNAFAFLRSRGIPDDVTRMLMERKLLYQADRTNNLVFVNPQGDFFEQRGTNSYADHRCKRRNNCADYVSGEHTWCSHMQECPNYKKDGFHQTQKTRPDRFWYLTAGTDCDSNVERIYVCEGAIDAVSLYVIHQRQGIAVPAAYVSIGGVANQSTIDRLKRARQSVIIATDNDDAGDKCRKRNSECETIRPVLKDWNDDLKGEKYYVQSF